MSQFRNPEETLVTDAAALNGNPKKLLKAWLEG